MTSVPPRRPLVTTFARPPSVRVHWYASAPFQHRNDAGRPSPHGVVHAREIGAAATACGVPAQTWRMFFDRPFAPDAPAVCPCCAEAVRREGGVERKTVRQLRRVRTAGGPA